jgi:DNA-binding MarR family transcriptional regulator
MTFRESTRIFSSMSNHISSKAREALVAQLVERLRRAADRADALVQRQLKPHGLSVSQGRLFGLVADLSLEGQAPLQKDLEAGMGLVASSITSLIQGLENQGLLARVASTQDGRAKELHITARGWKVYKDLGRQLPRWHRELASRLDDQDLATAVRLLAALAADGS